MKKLSPKFEKDLVMACPTPPLIKLRNKGTMEMPPMLLLSLIPSLNGIGLRMGYIWYLLCLLLFFWRWICHQ